jgi:hypothetical protein
MVSVDYQQASIVFPVNPLADRLSNRFQTFLQYNGWVTCPKGGLNRGGRYGTLFEVDINDRYTPYRGLLRLAWWQILAIDAKLSSLCSYTEENGGEARLVIIVKKGKIRHIERVLSDELTPQS